MASIMFKCTLEAKSIELFLPKCIQGKRFVCYTGLIASGSMPCVECILIDNSEEVINIDE